MGGMHVYLCESSDLTCRRAEKRRRNVLKLDSCALRAGAQQSPLSTFQQWRTEKSYGQRGYHTCCASTATAHSQCASVSNDECERTDHSSSSKWKQRPWRPLFGAWKQEAHACSWYRPGAALSSSKQDWSWWSMQRISDMPWQNHGVAGELACSLRPGEDQSS